MSNPIVAGGSGCDVCRARASHPEAISVDDGDDERASVVENGALRRYYYLASSIMDVPHIAVLTISLIIIISVYDCRASGARPRRRGVSFCTLWLIPYIFSKKHEFGNSDYIASVTRVNRGPERNVENTIAFLRPCPRRNRTRRPRERRTAYHRTRQDVAGILKARAFRKP